MDCPACRAAGQTGLVCAACGAILPPRRVDAFDALGLPPKFGLTTEQIEGKARELARKLHPDRFAKAAPQQKLAAVQATTTLNDAARTLRDPMRRAEALLAHYGQPLKEDERAPAALLGEVLELREALADAQDAGDTRAIEALGADVRTREAAAWCEVGGAFARVEQGEGDALDHARAALVELRYWKRFMDAQAGKDHQ